MTRDIVLLQGEHQFALCIFDAMTLVHDDIAPFWLLEYAMISCDVLVLSKHHIELAGANILFVELLTLVRVSRIHHHSEMRSPSLKLICPILKSSQRHNDKMRALIVFKFLQVGNERDGLNGFSEAHLVGQNSIQFVVVERHEPLKTFELIRLEISKLERGWLLVHTLSGPVRNFVVRVLILHKLLVNVLPASLIIGVLFHHLHFSLLFNIIQISRDIGIFI
mmetsp:Transcript_4943/g.18605  ORF Transcript_4943/g.18605 Transcript_4943/m.18605 type:complete len:222 (-) Transcript_4943:1561-2226(-)